ncbi:sarcoplasmic calcium-binding protein-like [Liolophura sinensis]|uniref:sarcoplasmic calcium-binding protein-like n=1 Tax=Liolophura sinensis TaxID=3198878 RepID=UPI003158806F
MDLDMYIQKKWTALFKFANFSQTGKFTFAEAMEYPVQLLRAGKVEHAFVLARAYKKHWDSILEALDKPKDEASVGQDDWVKAQTIVSKQDWYLRELIPTATMAFIDIMDIDKDGTVSFEEWRNYYTMQGVKSEEFIRSTFAKMDSNNDGVISRKEFEHALKVYNSRHEPGNDYSFLYTLD